MNATRAIRILAAFLAAASFAGCAPRLVSPHRPMAATDWADPGAWEVSMNPDAKSQLSSVPALFDNGLRVNFALGPTHSYVQLKKIVTPPPPPDTPLTFLLRANVACDLEVKFIDKDGSTIGTKIPMKGEFEDWKRVTTYGTDLEYWWGGDEQFGDLAEYHLAVSGTDASGIVDFDDIGLGRPGMPSSFVGVGADRAPLVKAGVFAATRSGPQIDPDADLPGLGFRQRRDAELIPEDPLVLEWLKIVQDTSGPGRDILGTAENNQGQTFNNSLVAQAFLIKGEKERAERILDFYARATVRDNQDPTLQNFFYKGEARGFFQHVEINASDIAAALHDNGTADRWMGDMAWLLFAYKHYEQLHGPDRYREITGLIYDLLVSWYKDDPNLPDAGYLQHGWRKGDKRLHEDFGHVEGNIDAHALFKLFGDDERARKVRNWVEAMSRGTSQPLDVYTWRVQSYDGERAELLDIPDRDLRYRKTMTVNGRQVAGVYHSANISVNNVWLDGIGHMACAYFAAGNLQRGNFYANQYDGFLFDRHIGGVLTRSLPYTANEEGGFSELDRTRGVISVAAWYIFAKNRFNPMTLKRTGDGTLL